MLKRVLSVGLAAALTTSASLAFATPPKPPGTPRAVSRGQAEMRERQKKCGAEWQAAKASGKIEKSTRWAQYWSECNKRLKART